VIADWQDVRWGCERWLASHRPQSASEELRAAAEALAAGIQSDHYGSGPVVEDFERDFAELLGKESAVLFPSGTMAQQVALRLHCDRRGTRTVAFHPTCHMELHEHAAYAHLHGLKAELLGHRDRLISLDDLNALHEPVGAVLLELPQREIGGQLPEWEDLLEQAQWVRQRGAALHLDGARIWEAAPYYGRSHAKIAGPFDTVYVSLYKGLLGLGGCVLAGSAELVEEARIWRRRHGGDLFRMFPLAAAARRGLEEVVPQMPSFLQHARDVAAALGALPGVAVVPDPPQTPLFHVQLSVDPNDLFERALDVARQRKVWLLNPPSPTPSPAASTIELNLGEPALDVAPAEVAELFSLVLQRG
jgi:threonine aldolase